MHPPFIGFNGVFCVLKIKEPRGHASTTVQKCQAGKPILLVSTDYTKLRN